MKKRLIPMLLALAMCAALCAPALAADAVFTDVSDSDPYAAAAYWCLDKGLMLGEGNNEFVPGKQVNRGTAMTILWRLAGEPAAVHSAAFSDVAEGAWYDVPVSWAVASGVTAGYEDGTFRPEKTVDREELAVFLWRAVGKPSGDASLTDASEVSAWAADAAAWAAGSGIFSLTSGAFDPQGEVTRGDAAVILMRYHQRTTVRDDVVDVPCAASGMAVMNDGRLLVTNQYDRSILVVEEGISKVWAGGGAVTDVSGRPVAGHNDGALLKSLFASPWAIAPFNGGWVVSDAENGALRFIRSGSVKTITPKVSRKTVTLEYPTGLAAAPDGGLYVADTHAGKIYKLATDLTATVVISGLDDPMGLCCDADGVLYVAETGADRIVKIEAGVLTVVAGGSEGGYADGAAASAQFAFPQGVAVDSDGTVYVADTGNSAVRAIRDGEVSTLLIRDPASEDQYPVEPVGLLLSGDTLYVCDSFARKVLAISVG